ncbi:DUF371 domain-containing protein [Halomarina rubra]|uniref:DUF371 domain-containing protein n=1 Tax=Halomarina rubra TaxID=2071873 RepID=A0ABD6AQ01_9EURY|nr:DUF371 domain-containing protein [Halomarina rubra]
MHEVTVHATGHEHVRATHESTLELTTDDWLTPAGDCIVGVEADTTPADLPGAFVEACQDEAALLTAEFRADDTTATVNGRGDPDLTFEGERSMVFRTSAYVDDRTVMVGADGAADDLDRDLVAALEAGADLTVTLRVE